MTINRAQRLYGCRMTLLPVDGVTMGIAMEPTRVGLRRCVLDMQMEKDKCLWG